MLEENLIVQNVKLDRKLRMLFDEIMLLILVNRVLYLVMLPLKLVLLMIKNAIQIPKYATQFVGALLKLDLQKPENALFL